MVVESMRDAKELQRQRPHKLLCRVFGHKWEVFLGEDGKPPHRKCVRCGLCITLPRRWYDAGKYWYEEVGRNGS